MKRIRLLVAALFSTLSIANANDTMTVTESATDFWGVSYLSGRPEGRNMSLNDFKADLIDRAARKAIYTKLQPTAQQGMLIISSSNDESVLHEVVTASSYLYSVNNVEFGYKVLQSGIEITADIKVSIRPYDESVLLNQLETDVHLASQSRRHWTPIEGRYLNGKGDRIDGTPDSLFVITGNDVKAKPTDYQFVSTDTFLEYWLMRYKVMIVDAYVRRGATGSVLGALNDDQSRPDKVFDAVLSHKPGQQIRYPDRQMIRMMDQAFVYVGKRPISVNNLQNAPVPIGNGATIQAIPSK
ncbi:hypothetical protein ACROAH_15390 [Shewanella oncorhynchi]|uniref:hypothetical protein n=1 Tax=Shewanella TaxID=22 RepID=UPI0039B09AC3